MRNILSSFLVKKYKFFFRSKRTAFYSKRQPKSHKIMDKTDKDKMIVDVSHEYGTYNNINIDKEV